MQSTTVNDESQSNIPTQIYRPESRGMAPHSQPGRFTPGAMLAGRFRVVALLGKGGMGEVYRAEDTRLGQQVALKFLPQFVFADAARLDRLYREVRLGRQVSHPNVCRLYDVMEWEGHHFISMEYIDGEDLASLLRRIGALPHQKAIDIARDLAAGLSAAHAIGIIHRDLKPANVMIDGRGTARITDFGLAGLADDPHRRNEISGTPAYMAPEQLAGQEVTARTDLYALGLIYYEMFSGKRLFEARTVMEILAQHESGRSQTLSRETKNLDPAVQRIIQRCLEEKAEARPSSVHAVMASLPGGDPLQAAVDAGETPSPEMVAAAGETGELRPAIAWGLLISVLLLILINAGLSQRTMLYGRVELPKQADVLAESARSILVMAGYDRPPIDRAFYLGWNNDYFERGSTPQSDLNHVRPSPAVFYYRESPRELFALGWERRVSAIDPPMTLAGEASVELDAAGRLIRFVVVPSEMDSSPRQGVAVDWSRFLNATGIDRSSLRKVESNWVAPVDVEEKAAWEGRFAGQPEVVVRIEAGSRHGKPIWLAVIPPWKKADRETFAGSPVYWKTADIIFPFVLALTVATAVFLARRNLHRSRGDRRGALRLALFVSCLFFAMRVLRADHVWAVTNESELVIQLFAEAVASGLVVWLVYIALEPYFRRRWPGLLIGWTRLLSGRFRDPMVGRDLLAGAVVGAAGCALLKLAILVPGWLGSPPAPPVRTFFTALASLRHLAYLVLASTHDGVLTALLGAFLFLLFQIVFRRTLVACLLLVPSYMVIASGIAEPFSIAFNVVTCTAIVLLFRRFGVLAVAGAFAFLKILASAPLTLDTSVWYLDHSILVMLFLSAVVTAGFWISLAAQPPFALAFLEED